MTSEPSNAAPDGAETFWKAMGHAEHVQEYHRVYQKLVRACSAQPELSALAAAWALYHLVRALDGKLWNEHMLLVRRMAMEYFGQVGASEAPSYASVSATDRRTSYFAAQNSDRRFERSKEVGLALSSSLRGTEIEFFAVQAAQATAIVKEYLLAPQIGMGTFDEFLETHLDFCREFPPMTSRP